MPDLFQLGFSIAVLVAAVGAIISVVITYRMSVSVRQIENTLKTKEGKVPSADNEEDARTPSAGPGAHGGDVDE